MDEWFYEGSVDSHTHLSIYESKGVDPQQVLERAARTPGAAIIDVGIVPEDLDERRRRFSHGETVHFSSGLHPTSVGEEWREQIKTLEGQLEADSGIVAIGELGLDFYHSDSFATQQAEALHIQFSLAMKHALPVIIHNRSSEEQMMQHLSSFGGRGVMHCFSQDADYCRRCLDQGMDISFGGNLSYKRSDAIRDAARMVPDDRLLVETDAPYLPPQPARGRPNSSALMHYTIETLAEVRSTSVEHIVRITGENARRLFGL